MWCPGPGEKRDAVPRSPGEGGMLSLIPGTKGDAVPKCVTILGRKGECGARSLGKRGDPVP